MMIKKIVCVGFVVIGLLLNSCKNEINIVAPGEPIPVVYGLLNPKDSIQYIKLTKAFVDKNRSALAVAKDIDVQYFPSNIQLIIQEILGGNIVKEFILDTVHFPKEEGIFSGPNNFLYKTNEPISENKNIRYLLKIISKESQQLLCNATTLSVSDFKITPPLTPDSGQLPILRFVSGNDFNNPIIYWENGANISKYDANLNFYYEELDTLSKVRTTKKLVWTFGNLLTPRGGASKNERRILGEKFFDFIASQLSPSPNILRYPKLKMEIEIFGAASDLATYIELNAPSYFISDIKPIYSNISNGIGIFSSRTSSILKFETDLKTLQFLKKYPPTANLGFIVPQ